MLQKREKLNHMENSVNNNKKKEMEQLSVLHSYVNPAFLFRLPARRVWAGSEQGAEIKGGGGGELGQGGKQERGRDWGLRGWG